MAPRRLLGRLAGVALVLLMVVPACGDGETTSQRSPVATPTSVVATERSAPTADEITTSTIPVPTTAWVSDDPIEVLPGVGLTIHEPGACTGQLRPAILTQSTRIDQELVEHGYVVAVFSGQRAQGPGFSPEMVAAITRAVAELGISVQWLRAHADEYCIHPDAIATTGHSFGAITSLSLAYSEGEVEAGEVITIDELGDPVVNDVPPVPEPPADLAPFSNDVNAVVSFSGFALADKIEPGEAPALLVHGRDDTTVPFTLAEQTCAAATAVGVTCEIAPHDEGHGFAESEEEALALTLDFLERQMLAPAGLP